MRRHPLFNVLCPVAMAARVRLPLELCSISERRMPSPKKHSYLQEMLMCPGLRGIETGFLPHWACFSGIGRAKDRKIVAGSC